MAKRTQKAIVDAFVALLRQKPLDKITVMDICEQGGVSRSTFYYHYCDIYDLLESLIRSNLENMANVDFDADTWFQALKKAAMVTSLNKDVAINVCEGLGHNALVDYAFEIFGALSNKLMHEEAKRHIGVSEEDVEAATRALSYTFVGMAFAWLRNGVSADAFDEHFDIERSVNDQLARSFSRFPLRAA